MHIDNNALILRPEAEHDKVFLERLYRSTRDDLLQTGLPELMLNNMIAMQFAAQQSGYRNQFPDAAHAIVEKNGESIGSLITNDGGDAIRLVYIALLPHERNRGYGRHLIRALQTEAENASKALTLSVSTQNTQAQRLYASLGFRVVNNSGAYLEMIWTEQTTLPCDRVQSPI